MNIVSESEIMDIINDYLDSQSIKPLFIGAMIGTQVFQYAIELASIYTDYNKILIIEGIQDYIGMNRNNHLNNHKFYAELFENRLVHVQRDTSTLESLLSPEDDIKRFPVLNTNFRADVIIINDAHLIPEPYLNYLLEGCRTKIICIADPFDIHGEPFADIPTVVDTLHKLSNLMIHARAVHGIESRGIDKSVSSIFDKIHLTQRSIGRIDENQYVSNDPHLIKMIRRRQRETPFKKNQKLIVRDNHVIRSVIERGVFEHDFPLTRNSMVHIVQTGVNMLFIRLRVFASKEIVYAKPAYDNNPVANLHVDPANILTVEDSAYHRYKHLIFVPNAGYPLTKRECYSLFKSTSHLSIVE